VKKRIALLVFGLCAVLAVGCAPTTRPVSELPVEPVILSHLGDTQKRSYVAGVKQNLRHLLATAGDLASRNKPAPLSQLASQAQKYIETYVRPAIADPTLSEDLETRMEVAKVHLLVGYVYARCGTTKQAGKDVELFKRRYADDPAVLSSALDRNDFDADNLGQALQTLERLLGRG